MLTTLELYFRTWNEISRKYKGRGKYSVLASVLLTLIQWCFSLAASRSFKCKNGDKIFYPIITQIGIQDKNVHPIISQIKVQDKILPPILSQIEEQDKILHPLIRQMEGHGEILNPIISQMGVQDTIFHLTFSQMGVQDKVVHPIIRHMGVQDKILFFDIKKDFLRQRLGLLKCSLTSTTKD